MPVAEVIQRTVRETPPDRGGAREGTSARVRRRRVRRSAGPILVASQSPSRSRARLAVPFWGAKESMPADTAPAALKPGEFVWDGDAPSGPMVVVVSLTEQRAYVYRNGVEIGVTTVSTGKPGHQTPTGIFTVLQKDKDHHSSMYNNAAMPYKERLTWGGVALHAGGLPGYPSSHGCVHLPSEFAQHLFAVAPMGMTVVVVDSTTAPATVVHPAALAPVDPATGADGRCTAARRRRNARWQPEKSPTGPVSILISAADRRVIVFRNGVEIGRAKVAIPIRKSRSARTLRTPLTRAADAERAHALDRGRHSRPRWARTGAARSRAGRARHDPPAFRAKLRRSSRPARRSSSPTPRARAHDRRAREGARRRAARGAALSARPRRRVPAQPVGSGAGGPTRPSPAPGRRAAGGSGRGRRRRRRATLPRRSARRRSPRRPTP